MAIIQSEFNLITLTPESWYSSGGSQSFYDGYAYDYATIYKTQPNVRTCVDFLARNIAQLNLHVFRRKENDDRERLRDHALAKLISNPLPREFKISRYRLFENLVSDLGIYFNAYWLKLKRDDGVITGLLRIPPHLVQVKGG